MQMLSVENDGTTTIKFTDAEAHQLRDALADAARTGDDAAWTLQRLLSHAHGDTEK
ncbi:hypothetical protein ACIQMV_08995 [Streptomyces sp. NPDC091412]|uniref:hypothetical protein n=1 Tax=Streptomyces sp. NPDC091412 TaxID=3366002 RepID=UPI00382DB16E